MNALADRRSAVLAAIALWLFPVAAIAQNLPPPPARHFNDYAGVVSASVANSLDRKLQQAERDTTCQLVVAVFPRLDSSGSVPDYTVRVAQNWRVGQKGKDNGAVLFVFIQNRQMRIEVGYGMEGTLTDARAHAIVEGMKPHFRAGNYAAGLTQAVDAMIAAARGEYRDTGQTRVERDSRGLPVVQRKSGGFPTVGLIILVVIVIVILSRRRGPPTYGNPMRRYSRGVPWVILGSGRSSGGFGGRGGFSGGGGRFGGGGAGGSW